LPEAQVKRDLIIPDRPSIAVLPFSNKSGDPGQDYFSDGLTEDIVTNLARCRWLFVIGRSSSLRYRGGEADAHRAGQELGVRYVLDGSVRRSGDRMRVSCQLIEADSGAHLWAERYDCTLTDVFEMQDDITRKVVAVLEPTVKRAEIDRARRKRPEDLGTYELYLCALQHMYDVRAEERAVALEFAERALQADPDYAEAHGVAAWCYFARSLWEGSLPELHRERMLKHARAIQELPTDDASTLAHGAIALALATREFPVALGMIDRAIASNASSAHAYGHGSVINTWAGNYERSIALSEIALRLSPFDPLRVMSFAGQAGARLMLADYPGALSFGMQGLQVYPTHTPSFLISVAALVRMGDVARAREIAQRLIEVSPSYRILPKAPVLEHFVAELRTAGLPG
jgi:TolB-like protein